MLSGLYLSFLRYCSNELGITWLLILWVMIIVMIWKTSKACWETTLMFLPYLLWCTFAAYLNLMIAILN
ncbi:tryptophan-rich sensory protein [Pseudobutyrivibrio sp. JW11]|uniref:tryptophan-rich sensory protein n=1 Tax=Pseudobutyrivibrio sp. JW11 TaxID=1855302 RepID=UPI000B85244F